MIGLEIYTNTHTLRDNVFTTELLYYSPCSVCSVSSPPNWLNHQFHSSTSFACDGAYYVSESMKFQQEN